MMNAKTYAVTGVANGIGKALARILKADGHTVIGLDIAAPSERLDQFIEIDLSDARSISTAQNAVTDPLDGLCNSAGLPPRPELEEKILAVNFLGTREFTRSLLPKLKAGSSVVNLASRAGQRWPDNIEQVKRLSQLQLGDDIQKFIGGENIDPIRAYDLSKEAIILWTMACSETYSNADIRINSISPGAVQTDILKDFRTAFGERMAKNVERAGRAGTADEVAHLAAFLLSSESGWIKGTDIAIDGGMSAFNTSDALSLSGLV